MEQNYRYTFKFNAFIIILICLSNAKATASEKFNCSVNGLTHNYLAITDPIYDTDLETKIPYSYDLPTENVTSADATSDSRVIVSLDINENLLITIPKLNEKYILSHGTGYNFKFVLTLRCADGSLVAMNTVVPFIDSNNQQPFFSKPKYIYNLISTFEEDFKRQLDLNPITATDYDVTNGELLFGIQNNEYFNIVYGGIVPGSLNKRHFAQLVPKFPGKIITRKIEVTLTVTDVGLPSNSNFSRLVINPPSPPKPVFVKPFYVGHLYKNNTFQMSENPQLEEGTTYYKTNVDGEYCSYLRATLVNGEIILQYYWDYYYFSSDFYRRNYYACTLEATYTDARTQLISSGKTAIIVEYHHDL